MECTNRGPRSAYPVFSSARNGRLIGSIQYGGASAIAYDGIVYFSHFKDGRVYRQKGGEEPVAITPGMCDSFPHAALLVRSGDETGFRPQRTRTTVSRSLPFIPSRRTSLLQSSKITPSHNPQTSSPRSS